MKKICTTRLECTFGCQVPKRAFWFAFCSAVGFENVRFGLRFLQLRAPVYVIKRFPVLNLVPCTKFCTTPDLATGTKFGSRY